MSRTVYATLPDSVFAERQQKTCEHKPVHVTTFDATALEKICLQCGMIFPTEPTVAEKLDRAFDLEQFMNLRYGPATPEALEKFLLPTLAQGVKCRDKFVDTNHLHLLRRFTDIQRICQRYNIPNEYAVETMRVLMKQKKGIFSTYIAVEVLQGLLEDEPRLHNRIHKLQALTRSAEHVRRLRAEVRELRKQPKHHNDKVRKLRAEVRELRKQLEGRRR